MSDNFDIVAVELEREIYNRSESSEPKRPKSFGCLSIFIGLLALFVILEILHAFSR